MDIIKYNMPVIYQIINTVNKNSYIGSSQGFVTRQRLHRSLLRRGKHFSKYLQHAWNKYGEDQFTMIILETVLFPDLLIEREQYWIDKLKPQYNSSKCADPPMRGHNHTAESRQKMSDKKKGANHPFYGKHRPAGVLEKAREGLRKYWALPENRKRQSERMKGQRHGTANKGRPLSDETKRKLSAINKGKPGPKFSEETLKRMSENMKGANNPMYGKCQSEEHRRKRSEALSGTKNPMYGKCGSASPNYGKKRSEETRKKISLAVSGENHGMYGKNHSEESKRKISIGCQGKESWDKGMHLSDEHRQKISAKLKGRALVDFTTEVRQKISKANKGRKHSLETRQQMRESQKRRRQREAYAPL